MKASVKNATSNFLKKYGNVVIFVLVFFFVSLPLFHGGFFPTMDDVQVVRIDHMTREILAAQFPVRMINQLAFGAGDLLFNFYGTLAYYIGAIYHLLGLPLVRATKFVFITGYLIGGIGIYFLIRKYADKITSTICSLLFLTATYVNYDVYTRGSLGEFFGFVTLPLLFWSFLRLREKEKVSDILISGIFYAIVVISHPLTAIMGSIFLLFLVLIPPVKKEYLTKVLVALLFGLSLSAFSWIPVAVEQQYLALTTNTFETQQYATNFFNPLQIAGIQHISWGIKPPLLGLGLFLGALFGIAILFHKKAKYKGIGLFGMVGFILSLFMISPFSKPLWDLSPYIRLVQFPWRYLVMTTIFSIILIGVFLTNIKNVWFKILIGLILFIPAVTLQYSYLRPASYNYIAVYTADDACNSSTWAQEYLPKWVKTCITKKTNLPLVQSIDKSLTIYSVREFSLGEKIDFTSVGQGTVRVRKYYFPGWTAVIDGKKVATYPSTQYGLVTFKVPSGKHNIIVSFENTWDRTVGNFISLFAVLIFLGVIILTIIQNSHSKVS